MTEDRQCPQCGRPVPADAPGGVCPVCLLTGARTPADAAAWSGGARDTNLLFVLFGHLLGYVNAEQFTDAIGNWTQNPSVSIADQLVEQGVISAASRHYLEGLIAHTLDFYEGNVTKTLESLGGHERVALILKHSANTSARELVRTRLALKVPDSLLDDGPAEEVTISERRGRYTGSSEYSRGGMGRILLVHDELLARDIALKELLPTSDDYEGPQGSEPSPIRQSAALVARFLREARITGRLEHPSIVPVYELGRRENGGLYYTMRLVRGKTLRTVLQECKTLEDRLKLLPNFVDLCMGIAYAHSRGVVHRDIKPSNIMIGEFGETVIIDWGLAKVVGQKEEEHPSIEDTLHRLHGDQAVGPDKTLTGEVLGSPHYMSPEQAGGRITEIDARSDVFSLGALLYEILANQAAFDKSSIEALIEQIQHEDPVPISTREPHAPKELASICYRAIQKEKAKRYPSAKQMGDDVNQFLAGSLVSAYNYGAYERLKHVYGRHKAAANMAFAAVALVVAVTTVAFIRINQSRTMALAAKERETVALHGAERARAAESAARLDAETSGYRNSIWLASEFTKDRNFSAAQDTLWATPTALRRWEWNYAVHRAYDRRYSVDGYAGIALQPGGTLAAFFYKDSVVSVRDQTSGAERVALVVPPRDSINYVAIAPLGNYLVAAANSGAVHLWELPSGRELYTKKAPPKVTSVAFARDGDSILVGTEDGAVETWAVATGLLETTFTAADKPTAAADYSPDQAFVFACVGTKQSQVWNAGTQASVLVVDGVFPSMSTSNYLAVINEGKVEVWNAENAIRTAVTIAEKSPIRFSRFRSGRNELVTLSVNEGVGLWNAETGEVIRRIAGGSGPVYGCAVSPDGELVTTWNPDNRMTIWNLSTGARIRDVSGHTKAIFGLYVQFSTDGNYLFASTDHLSSAWEARSDVQQLVRREPSGILPGIVTSRDGNVAAFCTREGILKFHLMTGQEPSIGVFVSGPSFSLKGSFGPTAGNVAFAGDTFTPIDVDVATGAFRAAYYGNTAPVTAIDSDPTRDEIATGCWDARVRVFRRSTGELLRTMEGHAAPVSVVRYRKDGKALFTADDRGGMRLWAPASGSLIARATAQSGAASGEWSPAMDSLAVGQLNGSIGIFDAHTLSNQHILTGATKSIAAVAYLDAERLVSGDSAGLRIWNMPRIAEALTIADSMAYSTDVSVLAAGGKLLTRCTDGTLRIWAPHPWTNSTDRRQFEEERVAPPPAPTPSAAVRFPSRVVVITTSSILVDSMRKLLAALPQAAAAPDGSGVLISGGAMQRAVVRLGLMENDSLATVGRIEVRSVHDTQVALTELIAQLQSPTGPVELRIVRNGEASLFQVQLVDEVHTDTSVQVARGDAIDAFSAALEAIAVRKDAILELSRRQALELGDDPGPGGAIAGLWLGESGVDADRDRYRRLGMSAQDRIVAVNGTPVNRIDVYADAIRIAVQQIQQGIPVQVVLDVERGNFQRVKHTIEIP